MGNVLRRGIERSARRRQALIHAFTWQRPLLREQLIRDALLDEVGLTREDLQRFVLGFPAKPRDRSGVAFAIERSADAEAVVGVRRVIGEKRRVVDVLDQACAERGRWNA